MIICIKRDQNLTVSGIPSHFPTENVRSYRELVYSGRPAIGMCPQEVSLIGDQFQKKSKLVTSGGSGESTLVSNDEYDGEEINKAAEFLEKHGYPRT